MASQNFSDHHFRDILEALPAAVYATDADGRITYYNEAAATLWGCRPELGKAAWCGSWKIFWPDGRPLPHDQCPMAIALQEGRPVRGIEAIAERPDGTRVPFLPFPTPFFDKSGAVIGGVNLLVDISDRKNAEQSIQRLASIVDSCNDAIVSKDLNGIVASWNRGAERLFGFSAHEMIGQSITKVIPADRHHEEYKVLERIRSGERIDQYETVRQRKDGTLVDISLTVSPVRNAEGRIVGASKIAYDITARKRLQEKQELLLGEMRHRINNTLAMVQAIASQSFPSVSKAERAAFGGRIGALSAAHDVLRLTSWDRAALGEIVAGALKPFQENGRERFLVEGPDDVWLDSNQSMLVTMALHELATNAVKYGALSVPSGRVSVTWELVHEGQKHRTKICWMERGGPPVVPPTRKGFGSRLIERVLDSKTGGSNFDFKPQGLTCTLHVAVLPAAPRPAA
jgi:PAS domain S-box-containing protein